MANSTPLGANCATITDVVVDSASSNKAGIYLKLRGTLRFSSPDLGAVMEGPVEWTLKAAGLKRVGERVYPEDVQRTCVREFVTGRVVRQPGARVRLPDLYDAYMRCGGIATRRTFHSVLRENYPHMLGPSGETYAPGSVMVLREYGVQE